MARVASGFARFATGFRRKRYDPQISQITQIQAPVSRTRVAAPET